MLKKILVPTDFSDNAKNALDYAMHLAEKTKAELVLFHAFYAPAVDAQMPGSMMASLVKEEEEISIEKLKLLVKEVQLQKDFSKIKYKTIATLGFAVEEIINVSEDQKVDLIVMGTKGASGWKELLLGSNTANVIGKSVVPVLVIPEKAKFSAVKKMVYASDFKSEDLSVMEQIIAFAELSAAKIAVLHIRTSEGDEMDEKINQLLASFKDKVNDETLSFFVLNKANIAKGIDEFVKFREADMLAMATYNRGLVDSLFHKSITKKMAYHTHIPLLAFHKAEIK